MSWGQDMAHQRLITTCSIQINYVITSGQFTGNEVNSWKLNDFVAS